MPKLQTPKVTNGEVSEVAQKPEPKKKVKKIVVEERQVIYPTTKVRIAQGSDPLTVEQAKDLLGCTTDELEARQHGCEEPLFKDRHGTSIWAKNNVTNRPLYLSNVEGLVQELLQKRWAGPNGNGKSINGEPIIIGKTGLIENGQHQLVALVLADQDRASKRYWEENWPNEVVMDKLIVFGIDEDDQTVNTMDTCKPRSLADVIYRSDFFKKLKPSDRKTAGRMTDYCIRMLWHRTGADANAFAPRRTHAEALDFIERHQRILKCVSHIYEEYKKDWNNNNRRISGGYAAAMLYLMGASATDAGPYHYPPNANPPSEKKIDWEWWDKARMFWTGLVDTNNLEFKELREEIGALADPDGGHTGSMSEKTGIIAKAWALYMNGEPMTSEGLRLAYREDEYTGIRSLVEFPEFGGIDMGDPASKEKEEDPTPAEIVKRAAAEKQESLKKKASGEASSKPKKKGDKKKTEEPEEELPNEEVDSTDDGPSDLTDDSGEPTDSDFEEQPEEPVVKKPTRVVKRKPLGT